MPLDRHRACAVVFAAALAACAAPHASDGTRAAQAASPASDLPSGRERPTTFRDQVAPIAERRCDGCHTAARGGPMADYRKARSLVTPGKPEQSPYYALPGGHPSAWDGDAAVVREWIAQGAAE